MGHADGVPARRRDRTAQLIVLGSTRLESYALDTGEPRWWMPIGSSGVDGHGRRQRRHALRIDARIHRTVAAALRRRICRSWTRTRMAGCQPQEFSVDKELGEHFGWIDTDGDNFITADGMEHDAEPRRWENTAPSPSVRQSARGKLDPNAVLWRFQKNLPYIPAPLIYQDVFYLVKDGGIITSLDPATGRPLKEGRSPDALGEYLRVTGGGRRQGVPGQRRRQDHRPEGVGAVGGPGRQRYRRGNPRHAGAQRRADLRADARRRLLLRRQVSRTLSRRRHCLGDWPMTTASVTRNRDALPRKISKE